MLQGLDSHSMYLTKKDMWFVEQLKTGKFSGIGLEVMPEFDSLKVISPIDGSPAQKAGILPNDEIIAIDDKTVQSMSFRGAIEALRGPESTNVKLTLVRPHQDKPLTIVVTRREIIPQNIKSQLIKPNMGYVRIATFQQNTPKQTRTAIQQLITQNKAPLKSFILDLRNDPGGILESAIGVSELFLDYKKLGKNFLIVYSENRDKKVLYSANTLDADILNGAPMIILVNKGSASGSEIVAGALHDHHRAKLLGTRTFGKGSVQTVFPFGDDAIKLTTALYYTPNGKLINHIGIPPDIEVKMIPHAKPDVQLARAVEILR
jgi:carboxyl-terminal processing protease